MNVYVVRHSGIWLGGMSIVVAESEARALSMVKFGLVERKLPATDITVEQIETTKEQCLVVNDGDH